MILAMAVVVSAHAQTSTCYTGWTCDVLLDGVVDIDTASTCGEIYVGSAIQVVRGLHDELFFTIERSTAGMPDEAGPDDDNHCDELQSDRTHDLVVLKAVCDSATTPECDITSTSTLDDLGFTLEENQYTNHSMVHKVIPPALSGDQLHILTREDQGTCDEQELDIREYVWVDGSGTTDDKTVEASLVTCFDRRFTWVQLDSSDVFGTWTKDPDPSAGSDEYVRYGERTGASWGSRGDFSAAPTQNEHAQFVFNGSGDRLVGFTANDSTDEVWLGAPDAGAPPPATIELKVMGESDDVAKYATVGETADGDQWVFYYEDDDSESTKAIVGYSCSSGCGTLSNWGLDTNAAEINAPSGTEYVKWLQFIEASNERQFLVWEQKLVNTVRVNFSERCPGDDWETPITPWIHYDTIRDQNILSGNPNIDVDNTNDVLYLVFQETDDVFGRNAPEPVDSNVMLLQYEFDDCD